MLFSQVQGLPVVTLGEAAELGVLASLTVEVASGHISHLRVSRPRGHQDTTIAWNALHALGPDAALVRSAAALDAEPATTPVHHEMLRQRILTEAGDERGTVKDVSFDPETGRIGTVHTALGELPADSLLGLGEYALVVRAEPATRHAP
ncbi:PRC-barrel domain-containing protein [Streptomyces minutiscleroticus]|uniref:PRC-barrel domain-containing protein n=1 Tax=Streptomyces minutiscleroticus TaxID=68238 RepID=A0A918KSS6_9ACTN|nr:PRC-barrel domain-containing protein [Streptomyces minutiscleroticus]GGX75728.1 hypothetical protein GCM10010358_32560 [Streptomyces minutiscleroticus]